MSKHSIVFIGTYTEPILFGTGKIVQGKGQGIYTYRLDRTSGALKPCGLAEGVRNPSYLTFDSSRRFLYAVNELKEFEGAPTGAVSAFSVDPESGRLTFLNQKPSHGTDPCHLTVDRTGRYVLVANFMSGSVCVLPIRENGSLGDATDVVQHQGSSADPVRQAGPHAHAVTVDNTGRYVFVPDLGIDKLMIYKFDPERGKLEPNQASWVEVTRGAGPRQVVMHPGGEYVYLINELNSTLTTFRYEKAKGGMLREIQTLATLPEDFKSTNTCAEVQISPSGKFLYGSNRGHDSIVIYAVDQKNGRLTCLGYSSTQGKTPRHFGIDPAGEFLLVANQDTESVITFRLDPAFGNLNATGHKVEVPTPVCVRIM